MRSVPRPLQRLAVVGVALLAVVVWDQRHEWPAHLNPDSFNYVHNEEIRGWVYPAFIDLVMPEAQQETSDEWGWSQATAPGYERLVAAQRLVLIASLALLFWVLSRDGWLAPLGLLAGAVSYDAFLVGDISSGLNHWVGSVNPEALVFPWTLVLFVLSWLATESPTRPRLLVLGGFAALGVDLAPRLLPFAVLTFAPVAGAWIRRASGAKLAPTLLAFLFFAVLVGVRSGVTYARDGVFAPAAYNGYSTIGIALQFADAEDHELFDDRREQLLVYHSIRDPRRRPSHPVQGPSFATSFVNMNTWVIAWPAYKQLWEDPSTHFEGANLVFSKIAGTLLTQGDNLARWASWAVRAWGYCLLMRWHTTALAAAWLYLAVLLWRRAPAPLVAMLLVLSLAHLANVVTTVTLQGIHARYILNSEFLLLCGFGVLALLAFGDTEQETEGDGAHVATPAASQT